MTKRLCLSALVVHCLSTSSASAQIVEAVGSRALGMGGAFVAVANDSSATWWNPAGLAAGPFLDLAIAKATTGVERLPARRDRASSFALGTPPFGFSYYHLHITDIQPLDPTAAAAGDREDRRVGMPVRSLSAIQLGATFVHTLVSGAIHVGTTLKYVRGTVRRSVEDGLLDVSDLLDGGEDLRGGDSAGRFDLDVGVLATAGPFRVGGVIRNVREPAFDEVRLPRQVRLGAAFDGERAGLAPFMIAIDADVRRYDSPAGERRVIALGGEQWFAARRFGIRGGVRFNAAGAEDRAATGGISVAVRSGMYVDGHMVRGGHADERGWGLAARVSF